MQSNHVLHDILRHGILLWFRGSPYDPATVPARFRQLIIEQNNIGWHQLFRGRLSQEWRRHHDHHLQSQPESDHTKSGGQWARSIARHFMQRWLQLWKLRNDSRHGDDPEAVAAALRAQVHRELAQVYSFRTSTLPRDRDLFYSGMAEHLAAHPNISAIRNWISTNLIVPLATKKALRKFQIVIFGTF